MRGLKSYASNGHSQGGEDGIILEAMRRISELTPWEKSTFANFTNAIVELICTNNGIPLDAIFGTKQWRGGC